jgi:hypothetical protein
MDKTVNCKATVTKTSRKCPVCFATIQDNNYCLKIKTGNDRAIYIHDNEGACLEVYLVSVGMAEPTILSAMLARYL